VTLQKATISLQTQMFTMEGDKALVIIEKIINVCDRISLWVTDIFLAAMTILIFFEIIARTFLGFSTLIADEYSRYFLVAIVFLGLFHTFKKGNFIRVDFFYTRFFGGPKVRRIVDIFILITSIVYTVIITKGAFFSIESSIKHHSTSVFISETPLWIPNLIIPIGLIFFLILLVIELLKRLFYQKKLQEIGGQK